MYAIIQTGGKQYKAEVGKTLKIEKLDAEVNATVKLPVVMIVSGTSLANKGECQATVVAHGKGEKLDIFTYKAKKNERSRQGHRQPYTEVKITAIK